MTTLSRLVYVRRRMQYFVMYVNNNSSVCSRIMFPICDTLVDDKRITPESAHTAGTAIGLETKK